MSDTCARFLVSGHVQGVFFRASTRKEALRLNLTGRATNLDDGRVEVVACGSAEALDELEGWLQHGPSNARVDSVSREEVDAQDMHGFETR